jgi:hypothetical protein
MRRPGKTAVFCLAAVVACLQISHPSRTVRAQPGMPVVHAVLFYSPMCSFCEEIMEQELPPRIRKYGAQLDILQVSIETAAGMTLYQAALETYAVSGGIPVLFLADTVLKGEAIPEQLPELVDAYLLTDGADWPGIPGLEAYRRSLLATAAIPPTATPHPPTPTFAVPPPVPGGLDGGDPVVRALLFFSPTCSHCRYVQDKVLPPLQDRFGKGLDILHVDTRTEQGYSLYQSAFEYFHLQRPGVPFLVIGMQFLLGSDQIEEWLPSLVEQ